MKPKHEVFSVRVGLRRFAHLVGAAEAVTEMAKEARTVGDLVALREAVVEDLQESAHVVRLDATERLAA